jgi:uncharacterized membrane protein (Fun14 family)
MDLLPPNSWNEAKGENQPEPVIDAARVTAAVTGVVAVGGAVLAIVGYATQDQVQNVVTLSGAAVMSLSALINIIVPYVMAIRVRMQVTPLASPQTSAGVSLVPNVNVTFGGTREAHGG